MPTSPSRLASSPASIGLIAVIVLLGLNLRPVLAAIGPVLDEIQAATGLGHTGAGMLTTLPVLAMGLGALAGAWLYRALGTVAGIRAGIVLIALACAARVWASSATGLIVTALLAGVGIAGVQALLPAFIREQFAESASRVMGIYSTAIMGGAAVAAAATPWLAAHAGWPIALACWAVPALVAAGVWWAMLARRRGAANVPVQAAPSGDIIRADASAGMADGKAVSAVERAKVGGGTIPEQAASTIGERLPVLPGAADGKRRHAPLDTADGGCLHAPSSAKNSASPDAAVSHRPSTAPTRARAWLLMIFFGLGTAAYTLVLAWLPPFYTALGWTSAQSGLLLSGVTLMEVTAGLLVSAFIGRFPDRRPALAAVLLALLLGLGGLLLAPDALAIPACALLGLGIGGLFPLTLIVTLDHAPEPAQAGKLMGFVQGGGYLIASAMPLAAGALRAALGNLDYAWMLMVGGTLVLAAMAVRLKPPSRRGA